jgi:predicted ABC-type transport system involved in lysophospholipase L1 biosynthesis ATPase subunit
MNVPVAPACSRPPGDSRGARATSRVGPANRIFYAGLGVLGGAYVLLIAAMRVALGRALASRPRVLCLDEPLGALDAHTREQMYELLAGVARERRVTALHVTHDPGEARRLADYVFSLVDGRIETVVPPRGRR